MKVIRNKKELEKLRKEIAEPTDEEISEVMKFLSHKGHKKASPALRKWRKEVFPKIGAKARAEKAKARKALVDKEKLSTG